MREKGSNCVKPAPASFFFGKRAKPAFVFLAIRLYSGQVVTYERVRNIPFKLVEERLRAGG